MNMMNKLIYGRDAVLLPMSGRLLGGGNTEVLGRLESLNTELAMVAERRQAADKFFAKGLLDAAVYREELDALAQKERKSTPPATALRETRIWILTVSWL